MIYTRTDSRKLFYYTRVLESNTGRGQNIMDVESCFLNPALLHTVSSCFLQRDFTLLEIIPPDSTFFADHILLHLFLSVFILFVPTDVLLELCFFCCC